MTIIQNATSLDNLLNLLRGMTDADIVDMTNLPVFGGAEPASTSEVWSWDEGRLMVGASVGSMEIVTRAEWADR